MYYAVSLELAECELSKVIEDVFYGCGFIKLTPNLYRSEKERDILALFRVLEELPKVPTIFDNLKSLHSFEMEGWTDVKKEATKKEPDKPDISLLIWV